MDRFVKQYRIFPAGALVSAPEFDIRPVAPLVETVMPEVLTRQGFVEQSLCPAAQAHLNISANLILDRLPEQLTVAAAYRFYGDWFCDAIDINIARVQVPRLQEDSSHVQ